MNSVFFWARIAPFLCMLSLCVGQILFKTVALMTNRAPLFSSPRAMFLLAASLGLYAVTTLAWIMSLRFVPLSKAYPILALAYALVPIGSYLFLNERVSSTYWAGVLLLIAGIAIIGRSQIVVS